MEEKNLLVKTETGALTFSDAVDQQLEVYEAVAEEEKQFRKTLLDLMMSNEVFTLKSNKYTFSQVVPKNTIIFDKEKFIEEQSEDLLEEFSKVETTETFDMEAFKAKYPEIYNEFVVKTDDLVVDEKSLSKKLPSIYAKYSTEVKSEKPITLKIAVNKK